MKTGLSRNACLHRGNHPGEIVSWLGNWLRRRQISCIASSVGMAHTAIKGGIEMLGLMRLRVFSAIGTTLIFLGSNAPAGAHLLEFDQPGTSGTEIWAINNKGDVAGDYLDHDLVRHGLIRHKDGTFVDLGTEIEDLQVRSINKKRMSVGVIGISGDLQGFLGQPDGTTASFAVPGASGTWPLSINGNSDVAGYYRKGANHGFLWHSANGRFKLFDAPGNQTNATYAVSLNDKGQIGGYSTDAAGSHGFIRLKNGSFDMFDIAGAQSLVVTCMNANGTVVGSFRDGAGTSHGFLRDVQDNVVTFDVPGAGTGGVNGTFVNAINKKNIATGYDRDQSGAKHGFVREVDGTIVTFDAPDADPTDGTLAWSINDKGAVGGFYYDDNGVGHGFIRTP